MMNKHLISQLWTASVFKILLSAVMCSLVIDLESVTSTEVFKRHANPIFIETGSCMGDGINNALQAGFKEVHSIEISQHFLDICKNRFRGDSRVHLHFGDSSIVLRDVLSKVNNRVTFWLDGHYSWNGTGRGNTNTPILQELAIIAEHPIKNHTILIDDVREFGTVEFDFIDVEDIISMLRTINPDYRISFEDGYIANDVLVAEIVEE